MSAYSSEVRITTKREGEIVDITGYVQDKIAESGIKDGICLIFCPGSTGGLSTIEYEPGLMKDVPEAMERIAPSSKDYAHNHTWGCDNGRSHVKATLIGPDLTVPVSDGKPVLGTWQQIAFLELDTRGRDRRIIVKVVGE
ncbi:MAG: secondary thiamine-phosphate synthase enzyme YjbQ [Candidatus Altiarchaeota archaeon]